MYRKSLGALFAYVSHKIPEISERALQSWWCDESLLVSVWEKCPFEIWDGLAYSKGIELATTSRFHGFRLGKICRIFLQSKWRTKVFSTKF